MQPATSGEHEEPTTAEVSADGLDPLVGQTLDGRFRIVQVIGKGAMGKVYRAVQLPLNRAVAIKVLDSRYGAGRDESFKQRFLVESALTSKLTHPNTVRVLDYGSTKDGLFFLAMEYLDGETLEKRLAQGALPWPRALSIAQQMARALREAHELGVVHRDLKPGNVVLLRDDDGDFVKVLDFGLVKSFVEGHELEGRAITQQGMLMGSPPYMAPEQGEKNRADPRSDIYSLGTILFEMLTGKPPFTGSGDLEVILKHVHEPVPSIIAPSHFESVPESLAQVLAKCLAKSPMDRFQSMEELLTALQEVSAAQPSATDLAGQVTIPLNTPEPSQLQMPDDEPKLEHPPRSPRGLLVVGFFLAAVAGVLGTWALVKPSPPANLRFHVNSSPAGASVFVDGKRVGLTPIDLERAQGQDHRATLELRLEKEGFAPVQVKLSQAGGPVEFLQTLAPAGAAPSAQPPKVEPQIEPAKPGLTGEKLRPEPLKSAPGKTEPLKAELKTPPSKAEPPKTEPKAEPLKAELKTPPSKAEPPKTEPKVEPPKAELKTPPSKAEPPKTEPKAEPAKKAQKPQAVSPKPKAEPKSEPKTEAAKGNARPASKLEDDEEAATTGNELKRPTVQ